MTIHVVEDGFREKYEAAAAKAYPLLVQLKEWLELKGYVCRLSPWSNLRVHDSKALRKRIISISFDGRIMVLDKQYLSLAKEIQAKYLSLTAQQVTESGRN